MTIWTDRFGEQIDIEKHMTNQHLLNVVEAICEGRVRASWDQASAMVRALDDRGLLPVAYNQEIYVSNILDPVMRSLRIVVDQRIGRPSTEPVAFEGGTLRARPVAFDPSRVLIAGSGTSYFDPTRVLIAGTGTSWTGRPESGYVLVEEPQKKPEPRPLKHDEKPFTYKRKIDV